MSLTIETKIVGFTVVSKSSDPSTKKQVEDFAKKLKQYEGRLLPQLDRSIDYMVNAGDQKFYFRRLTASNPIRMGFQSLEDLEKALNTEDKNNFKLWTGCSPDSGNCRQRVTDVLPADFLIPNFPDILLKNDMLCWHLETRFLDVPEKRVGIECHAIELAPKSEK